MRIRIENNRWFAAIIAGALLLLGASLASGANQDFADAAFAVKNGIALVGFFVCFISALFVVALSAIGFVRVFPFRVATFVQWRLAKSALKKGRREDAKVLIAKVRSRKEKIDGFLKRTGRIAGRVGIVGLAACAISIVAIQTIYC